MTMNTSLLILIKQISSSLLALAILTIMAACGGSGGGETKVNGDDGNVQGSPLTGKILYHAHGGQILDLATGDTDFLGHGNHSESLKWLYQSSASYDRSEIVGVSHWDIDHKIVVFD